MHIVTDIKNCSVMKYISLPTVHCSDCDGNMSHCTGNGLLFECLSENSLVPILEELSGTNGILQ